MTGLRYQQLPSLGVPASGPSYRESLPVWGPASVVDWRAGLPVLEGVGLTLRELRPEDAPSLHAELSNEAVARFISPPPATCEDFERFIRAAVTKRAEGQYACFAVIPTGETRAVGLFQIRILEGETAEWGFALGQSYWGTGLFLAGAHAVVHFAFTQMGLSRLEARAAVPNGRGNGALRKLGAQCEATLRRSFQRHGQWVDQLLWAMTADDWWAVNAPGAGGVH